MLKLHFKDNRQAPIWLVEERFTIGTDRRNQLVVNDPGVSAFHAEIDQRDGQHYLSDCNGNGETFVNEQRIARQYQLRPGDWLRLGTLELQLLAPSQASSATAGETAQRWYLQVFSGEQVGKRFQVQPGSMSLGRSTRCELCFSDPELSRRHAEFFLKDNLLEVRDMASANGVFVNRERVDTALLHPGDQVRMGSVSLLVIGPRVEVPATQEQDEDATLFMPMVEVPRPLRIKSAKVAANPLRTTARTGTPPATQNRAESGKPWAIWLAGATLALGLAVTAVLVL